jgi:carbonic anhydrase
MKRLYVRPAYRARGIGRALAEAAITAARANGHARIVLDSLPKMGAAQGLYRLLDFREVAPYLPEPTPGATCFELNL